MNKYNQKLPKEVEARIDVYIERIKAIKWFKPSTDLNRDEITKQATFALEAFGVKASVEYRSLKTPADWDAARGEAWGAAWDAARGEAWGSAWDAARGEAWGAAWSAAWDSARCAAMDAEWDSASGAALGAACDAAFGADDILVSELEDYKKKYPHGNFINLIPLWEAGLYPIGVVKGKFIIYVPE